MADKKKDNAVPMMIGVAVALVGAFLVNQQTSAKIHKIENKYTADKVYVAALKRDVKAGDTISRDDVDIVEMMKGPRIHTSFDQFRNPSEGKEAERYNNSLVINCYGAAKMDLVKGNLLLKTDILSNARIELDGKLESDKRAVTIEVDANGMMGGLLQPGDRVDVIASYQSGPVIGGRQNGREEITKVILENVELLAVGGQLESGEAGRSARGGTIVLGLIPDDALSLAAFKNKAKFSILLVSSKGSKGSYSQKELSGRDLEGGMQNFQNK